MFKKLATILFLVLAIPAPSSAQNIDSGLYGERLCERSEFFCIDVEKNDSWKTLFPNRHNRLLIKKLNRLNIALDSSFVLAVPRKIVGKDLMDYSPFPENMPVANNKTLVWDPKILAWATYDEKGNLVRWGPGVGGRDYCPDTGEQCRTLVGKFEITRKHGPNYISTIFNEPIPWYMAFHWRGFGFHGYGIIPGHNASHGCIRLFFDDARWLNQNFVEVGTDVIIRPY